MKIFIVFFIGGSFLGNFVFANFEKAQTLMQKTDCLSCHAKNQKIVGPSFDDISKKYQSDPQALVRLTKTVKNGGSGQWGALPMPPHPTLSEDEIKQMVEGILSLAGQEEPEKRVQEKKSSILELQNATSEDIERGQSLFQGKIRFAHEGPSCIACHHVKNDAVIGGGILAKDLTSVFSRLGEPGVQAILGAPPFPVMQQAYKERALTKEEIFALVAFLNDADQKKLYQRPKDYGMGLFLSGILGAIFLMLVYSLLGARRKKYSVNKAIYDRQIKSQ
ncbi:MAG: c-type cytochrome [Deltaproteobacteria bacterium]|nr:c-type cytochrome [Deltaproteobacteria bacterium]